MSGYLLLFGTSLGLRSTSKGSKPCTIETESSHRRACTGLVLVTVPKIGGQEELHSLVSFTTPGQDTGQDQVLIILGNVWKLCHQILDKSLAEVHLIGVHGEQGVITGDGATMA